MPCLGVSLAPPVNIICEMWYSIFKKYNYVILCEPDVDQVDGIMWMETFRSTKMLLLDCELRIVNCNDLTSESKQHTRHPNMHKSVMYIQFKR